MVLKYRDECFFILWLIGEENVRDLLVLLGMREELIYFRFMYKIVLFDLLVE